MDQAPYIPKAVLMRIFRFRRLLFFPVLLFLISASSLTAQNRRAVDAVIKEWMLKEKIPGVSIAVASHGKILYSKGYGMSDLENSVPVTTKTKFRLASISKPVTAAAVMQLVEQGKIALDSSIQTYLPSFPQKPWPVTIRQLLGHLGGIRHYRGVTEERRIGTTPYKDLEDALSIFSEDTLMMCPGDHFSYTTFGYNLLGVAVEKASGTPYGQYITEHIFFPAGMTQTVLDHSAEIIPFRTAAYTKDTLGVVRNAFAIDPSYKAPGGGILSVPEDMVRFGSAMMSGTIVAPSTFEQMLQPGRLNDSSVTTYGFGWSIGQKELAGAYFHNGGQQGATSSLLIVPSNGHAVCILTNMDGIPKIAEVARRIEQLIPHGR